jgi:uncharacterized cupredoxin-like copper-binding protein
MHRRYLVTAVLIVAVVGAMGGSRLSGASQATPRPTTDDSELSARVSALETRVAALEGIVGATPGGGTGSGTPATSVPSVAASATPTGGIPGARSTSVEIDLEDILFDPTAITVPANTPVTVTLVNKGAIAHTFDIDALDVHSGKVAPGATATVTINAPAGTYQYYCAEPGHKEAGMVGTLTVVDGSGASASQSQATSPAQASASTGSAPTINMEDIKFEPKEITIPANTDVVITLVNDGAIAHNFNIDALNIHSGDVPPGQSVTVTVNAAAGEYEYYCSIPGHKQAGMVGTLHVVAGGAAPPQGQAAPPPEVDMVDINFQPKEITIPANTPVEVKLDNKGAIPHNFNIDQLNVHSGDYQPGQTGSVTINAPPGDYQYYCSIPGHKEAGMVGTLRVGSDGAATSVPTGTAAAAQAVISLSGSGQTATDPIELSGGLYKFAATCDQGLFTVEVQSVTGDENVSVLLIGTGPYAGSTNVRVDGGRYALSIQCQGAWTLIISPVV